MLVHVVVITTTTSSTTSSHLLILEESRIEMTLATRESTYPR
jgi:hypothetical protein